MSANPYSTNVGRKLAYARSLLRLETDHQDSPVVRAALVQAALLHLQGAYLAFVREVGANYQLRDVDAIASARALCEALASVDKAPSEATELGDLEADASSWVGQLLALSREAQGMQPAAASLQQPAEGLIQVRPAEVAASSTDAATVRGLVTAFVDVVERQRETMIEC